MIARIQKSMKEKDQGFTLIELLVVMIIIGILAAIAVPVFLSQRAKAQDTATKSDAATVGKELATYFVDSTTAPTLTGPKDGRYTVAGTDAGAVSNNVSLTGANYGPTPASTWCVAFTNPEGSKKKWAYSSAGGLQEGTCTAGARVA